MNIQQFDYTETERMTRPMFAEHWDEVAGFKDLLLVDPDHDKYLGLEAQGLLACFVAFKQGVPIGYSINVLGQHIHYKQVKVCYNDMLFVAKEHRDSTAGGRLIVHTLMFANKQGCDLMQWHAKPGTALDRVLKARSKLHEHIYIDRL